jgi:hypothetical protein
VTYGQHVVRFLSEPHPYVCELPDAVDRSRPQMASVVTLTPGVEFTSAARSIHLTYRSDPSEDPDLVWLADHEKDGVVVSSFRINGSPPLLIAYWRLGGDRFMSTFMPARDALDPRTRVAPDREGLDAVIANVALGSACDLPVIALGGPLRHGDLRDPEQRDETQYAPPPGATEDWPVVQFRREPPWALESGTVRTSSVAEGDTTSWIAAWAVSRHQVRVTCHGPPHARETLREVVERVCDTLRPHGT